MERKKKEKKEKIGEQVWGNTVNTQNFVGQDPINFHCCE